MAEKNGNFGFEGGGNLKFKEPSPQIQGSRYRINIINKMDKSPKVLWGSPALKDGLNQRNSHNNNGSSPNNHRGNNNDGARMPWGSPHSPAGGPSFGPPMSTSSPKSPYYDNGKKHMQRGGFSGRNYSQYDSGGPGGTPNQHHHNSPRYNSPKSPFGGRGAGRSPYHQPYQSHGGGGGSPTYKPNQSGGSFNSSRSSSFYSTPKQLTRSFHHDNSTPYSPNSPNVSFNRSYTAEDYYKPSMLEDPWEKLRQRKN